MLIIMSLFILLIGCCKQDLLQECEVNNTFQLHYKNMFQYEPVTLVIEQDSEIIKFNVDHHQLIIVNVKVDYDRIYLLQGDILLDTFNTRPNPCANINYRF